MTESTCCNLPTSCSNPTAKNCRYKVPNTSATFDPSKNWKNINERIKRSGFGSGTPLDQDTFEDDAPILEPVERDGPPPSEDG